MEGKAWCDLYYNDSQSDQDILSAYTLETQVTFRTRKITESFLFVRRICIYYKRCKYIWLTNIQILYICFLNDHKTSETEPVSHTMNWKVSHYRQRCAIFHFKDFDCITNNCSQSKLSAGARTPLAFCVLSFTNKNNHIARTSIPNPEM